MAVYLALSLCRIALPVLLWTATSAAQLQFLEPGRRHLPPDLDHAEQLTAADFDGDGDVDLVVADSSGAAPRLLSNDGRGFYRSAPLPRFGQSYLCWQVTHGDVDGDSDLDLLFGANLNMLYLNDGQGGFTDATVGRLPTPGRPGDVQALALGDVDGDGDLDVVSGGLCLNDGTGHFLEAPSGSWVVGTDGIVAAIGLGDVDGDGDLDALLASRVGPWGGRDLLLLNDGGGRFTHASASSLPLPGSDSYACALRDLDGDGDLDALLLGNGSHLLLGDGSGTFSMAPAGALPASLNGFPARAVAVADVDSDGDLDVVVGGEGSDLLLLGDGAARFSEAPLSTPDLMTTDLVFADANADGVVDLFAGAQPGHPAHLHLGDGSGRFAPGVKPPLGRIKDLRPGALTDADGDGDLDLIVSSFPGGGVLGLQENVGAGRFTEVQTGRLPVAAGYVYRVEPIDIEGDGDDDLICACYYSVRLLLNDGTGNYVDASSRIPGAGLSVRDLRVADVNADGRPDIVLAQSSIKDTGLGVWLNDGVGSFTAVVSPTLPPSGDGQLLAVGDVDGDGDPDVVLRGFGRPELLLGDGSGVYSPAPSGCLWGASDFPSAMLLEDLNGDGNVDLFLSVLAPTQRDQLFLGDGRGCFAEATATNLPDIHDTARDAVALDFDLDGDLDLVVGVEAHAGSGPPGMGSRVLRNDGGARFTDVTATATLWSEQAADRVLVGDIDEDGDPDLIAGPVRGPIRLFANLHRQLDMPMLALPGGKLCLEIHRADTAPRSLDVIMAYLSPGPSRIPLPGLGTFGLDPNRMLPLQPLLLAPDSSPGRWSVDVPSDPNLIDAAVFAQALIVQQPSNNARLTNVVRDTIGR